MPLVTSASHWDSQIRNVGGSFLQSWQWGEFQAAVGRPVYRWSNGTTACQWVLHGLPLGKQYAFAPYGPVGEVTAATMEECMQAITQHSPPSVIFARVELANQFPDDVTQPFYPAQEIHPQHSWMVQLREPEVLLKEMKQKWRYNIRLAAKKGVTVRRSQQSEDIEHLYNLLSATAERQGITIHSEQYYRTMLETLSTSIGDRNEVSIYIAEFEGEVIAAALMIGFGDTYTYVHGGATYEHRAVMAPHAVQWAALQHAQQAGYAKYDFFGVAPPGYETNQPDHPWAGITRFKRGFGGSAVERGATIEIPTKPMWYTMYKLGKRFRSG